MSIGSKRARVTVHGEVGLGTGVLHPPNLSTSPEELFVIDNHAQDTKPVSTSEPFALVTRLGLNQLRVRQHRLKYGSLDAAHITNTYYNVRSGQNGFAVIAENPVSAGNWLTGTGAIVTVTVPPGRYESINHICAVTGPLIRAALAAGAYGTNYDGTSAFTVSMVEHTLATSDATEVPTGKIEIKIGVSADATVQDPKIFLSCLSSKGRDIDYLLGLVDSPSRACAPIPPIANALSTFVSPYVININHINAIRVVSNIGDAEHTGLIAHIPIHGVVPGGIESYFPVAPYIFKLRGRGNHSTNTNIVTVLESVDGTALEGQAHVILYFKLYRDLPMTDLDRRYI